MELQVAVVNLIWHKAYFGAFHEKSSIMLNFFRTDH